MRIVGGTLGGRRFAGPPADSTRPTSDRVREALSSALEARGLIEGRRVLDLFAGTGALAFEALSRGARDAVVVERDPRVARALRESATALGLRDRVVVEPLDITRSLDVTASRLGRLPPSFDLVFVDAPYVDADAAFGAVVSLVDAGVIARAACVVFEHAKRRPPASMSTLACIAAYEYGDTAVALLSVARDEP